MDNKASAGGIFATIAIVLVVLFVIINIVSFLFYPSFMPWFEQQDSGKEITKDTYDAQNAVQIYEEFRVLYNDIEAQRAQIENNYDELDRFYDTYGEDPENWDRTAQERHSRIQQRITGNQNQLENLVAEYNTMSQTANQEVFKCHLPYKVDESFGISGPPGSGPADEPVDTDVNGNKIEGEPPQGQQCDGLPETIES